MPGFTHLHTASGYSLRYGASHPERLAARAAERGMDALALTDRDTLAGTIRFAKAGVRPLFGVDLAYEATVPGSGRGPGQGRGPGPEGTRDVRRVPVRGGAFVDESAPRALFLARSRTGWASLCAMVTAAHAGGGGYPLLPWSALRDGDVFVLLGPASDVGRALAAGRPDRAVRLLAPWRERYGDALRLTAVDHGRSGTGPGSLRLAARTVGFAAEQGVRLPILGRPGTAPSGHRLPALDAGRGRSLEGAHAQQDHPPPYL